MNYAFRAECCGGTAEEHVNSRSVLVATCRFASRQQWTFLLAGAPGGIYEHEGSPQNPESYCNYLLLTHPELQSIRLNKTIRSEIIPRSVLRNKLLGIPRTVIGVLDGSTVVDSYPERVEETLEVSQMRYNHQIQMRYGEDVLLYMRRELALTKADRMFFLYDGVSAVRSIKAFGGFGEAAAAATRLRSLVREANARAGDHQAEAQGPA